jgi:hypothetical protein
MPTGRRSAGRRPRSRAARWAVPLAIPMALGLTLGVMLALSGGPQHTAIQQAAGLASASPSASPSVSGSPSPTATAPAPVTAAANVSCDIIVPAHPLTAAGLATPYQLTGTNGASPEQSGCSMANFANLGAFVQATILDPATGKLSVYEPLVITKGTQPAAAPVVPTLPRGAVVTIDFGFNGTNLTQVGATRNALREGHCADGLHGSIFGQVSFCNGTQFFATAYWDEWIGKLRVPSTGTSPKTGQPCLTTRSFQLVDQDQSDNVTSTYLLTGNGQTAQSNAANAAALPGSQPISNGSDNILLDGFVDPAMGCKPFQAPDLSQAGALGTSQALDELSAAKNQKAPVALVPENDEMTLVNGKFSVAKTDLYRANVGQWPVSWWTPGSTPANYCQNMSNLQTVFLAKDEALLATAPSPVPAVGNNLFTFMANRLAMSFTNLGCQTYGLTNPVTVTLDGNGAATAATFNTTPQQVKNGGGRVPWPWQRWGRSHHRDQDPSGA